MRNEGSHPCVASLPICQKTFINTEPGLGKDVMSPFLPGKGTGKTKRGRAPCNLSGRASAVLPPAGARAGAGAGPASAPPPAPGMVNRRSGGSAITPLQNASVQHIHACKITHQAQGAERLSFRFFISFWLFGGFLGGWFCSVGLLAFF